MAKNDNQAFARRLKLALTRNPKQIKTAADLANQFNLRHPKASITQQAASKWISGLAIPTPDKIETLASWLNVSTHWLQFGSADERPGKLDGKSRPSKATAHSAVNQAEEARLIGQYRKLSEHQRKLIIDMVDQLAIERDAWPSS